VNRKYSAKNLFLPILYFLLACIFATILRYNHVFTFEPRKETDFYAKNYTDISQLTLTNTSKRNVIIVFVESFNKAFAKTDFSSEELLDSDAVSFSNFIEGPMQRWTQGAFFSALTGTHIQYITDYWHYTNYKKRNKYNGPVKDANGINSFGEIFDFVAPHLSSLSKIDAASSYQNLFLKGGDLDFSGTKQMLLANGITQIYGFEELKKEYGQDNLTQCDSFPGVVDNQIFDIFKHKISNLSPDTPFLAMMFTLDLHMGYKEDIKTIKEQTIKNLNNFITWYKTQPFYENTTLIILGDHNQMGYKVKTGAKIYNAFFNLPENLTKNLNTNRTFNQIDIFPTVLEIMGYELPNHKAAMGTSLFSDQKTLAERYSYTEQKNFLNSHDLFYYNLWQKD
jgi:phosphoglycerol transferase